MSTEGGSAAEPARGLAGRLRAVASDGRARSQSMLRGWLKTGESATPGVDTVSSATASHMPVGPGSPRSVSETPDDHQRDRSEADAEPAGRPTHGPLSRLSARVHAEDTATVPALLRSAAAWCWRLLLVALVVYLIFRVAVALRLLVLPLIAATLLTALLQPLTARLRRVGLPPILATWCTLLVAIALLVGLAVLIANRVQADYPRLAAQFERTVHEVQVYLAKPPFRLNGIKIQQLSSRLLHYLAQHRTLVLGTVLTGGKYFLEGLTGLILTIFITFFLLKDGRRIWCFLISGLNQRAQKRAQHAGNAAWQALVSYVRGTTIVAGIHAVAIGVALWILGVPLIVPLVILVFLAAYVPLIGILVAGGLAILVTLATRGWVAAVILLAVLLAENQIESHLLQPLVVGRIVKLHPLAIIVMLTVGGIVAGVPGAIVAVPIAAVITYSWPYLTGKLPSTGEVSDDTRHRSGRRADQAN